MNIEELRKKTEEMPGGIIGIAAAFTGRYREFDFCVSQLVAPPNSSQIWKTGVNIALNFNNMVRELLKTEQLEWVWILGDDHTFAPDCLARLIERDVDIIAPLCCRRSFPFEPVVHESEANGYQRQGWEVFGEQREGLFDATHLTFGNAGMLIRRKVFEAIPEPWFVTGRTHPEVGGYDLWFCEVAREYGFKMYIDLDVHIGHVTHVAIWPEQHTRKDQTGKEIKVWGSNVRSPSDVSDNGLAVNQERG